SGTDRGRSAPRHSRRDSPPTRQSESGARRKPPARAPAGASDRHLVDDADDATADGQLAGQRHAEELADAGPLAQDEDRVALARLHRAIDGEKALPRIGALLVDRLHDEQFQARERRMFLGRDDGPQHLAEDHTESTMPTMAASTGTKLGSSARAASREPTRKTRSPGPARTVSTATSRPPFGLRW